MEKVCEKSPILYKGKENCCGCGACMEICPRQAITMKVDMEGFEYPYIDDEKCIRCYMCNKACPWSKQDTEK
jgi:ferredoxin